MTALPVFWTPKRAVLTADGKVTDESRQFIKMAIQDAPEAVGEPIQTVTISQEGEDGTIPANSARRKEV